MAERQQQQQQQRQQGSSFDVLLADLLQLVAEVLLIRRPPVQTATVAADVTNTVMEPPPDILSHLTPDTCPFCPGGSMGREKQSMVR